VWPQVLFAEQQFPFPFPWQVSSAAIPQRPSVDIDSLSSYTAATSVPPQYSYPSPVHNVLAFAAIVWTFDPPFKVVERVLPQ
jgi:hypothetical protein